MSAIAPDRYGWLLDLAFTVGLVTVAMGVLLGTDSGGLLTVAVGVPFILFLPGYAAVTALFPEQPGSRAQTPTLGSTNTSPEWITRLAFSFVLSIVIVAVVGVALSGTVGIRLLPAVGAIFAVTVFGSVVAGIRRLQRPLDRRAKPLAGRTLGVFSATSAGQNAAFVIAFVVLLSTVAFVSATPPPSEEFSESYVLAEGTDGELIADGYPATFVAGDGHPLFLGIENHEHRTVTYEVEVVVQNLDTDGTVSEQQQVDQFAVGLEHGEEAIVERDIAPTMTGDGLRLQFLIYKDVNPADASSADQTLQLWIDVVEDADG